MILSDIARINLFILTFFSEPNYPQPRRQLGQSRLAFFFVGMGSGITWANEWETAFPARAILAAAASSQNQKQNRKWEWGNGNGN